MPSRTTLFNDLAMSTLTEGMAAKEADAQNNERRKHPVFRIYSRIPGNENLTQRHLTVKSGRLWNFFKMLHDFLHVRPSGLLHADIGLNNRGMIEGDDLECAVTIHLALVELPMDVG